MSARVITADFGSGKAAAHTRKTTIPKDDGKNWMVVNIECMDIGESDYEKFAKELKRLCDYKKEVAPRARIKRDGDRAYFWKHYESVLADRGLASFMTNVLDEYGQYVFALGLDWAVTHLYDLNRGAGI